MHLETERLLMPPLSAEHTAALAVVYADPDVARYIGGAALDHEGTAAQVTRFESVWREHGYGQSALVDRATGALLGRAGLHPWPQWDEVELNYAVARHAQGRSLAREAAGAWLDVASGRLGVTRLTAVIHPDNAPSRALASRLGFRLDRMDTTPAGVPVVVHELLAPGRSSAQPEVELGAVEVAAVHEQPGEVVVAVVVTGGDATAVGSLGSLRHAEAVGVQVAQRQPALDLTERRAGLEDLTRLLHTPGRLQQIREATRADR